MTTLRVVADYGPDFVVEVHDKIAAFIEDRLEDPKAADVVRRAIRLFVASEDITFGDAIVALFGQATTHRERADVTRAGEIVRRIGYALEAGAA